jgi:hypothetical protein
LATTPCCSPGEQADLGTESSRRCTPSIRDHTPTLLLRLPNTTRVTSLAGADDGVVYLLTDIRRNEQAPAPKIRRLERN